MAPYQEIPSAAKEGALKSSSSTDEDQLLSGELSSAVPSLQLSQSVEGMGSPDNILGEAVTETETAQNENEERDGSSKKYMNGGDSDYNIGEEQAAHQNLAQTQFRDPFPALSQTRSRKTLSCNSQSLNARKNVAQYNTIPQFTSADAQSYNRCSTSSSLSGSFTPPPFTDYYNTTMRRPQSPALRRSNTPQNYLQHEHEHQQTKSPIQKVCSSLQKLWIDPFPTPDGSVCSSRYSSSSRIRHDSCDDFDNNHNGDNSSSNYDRIIDADWNTILQAIPSIPPIEELSIPEQLQQNEQKKQKKVANTLSCPRLHSMDVAAAATELPMRKVSSESALFPMIKRPSMEDIWGALQSGPDGNEFVSDYNKTSNNIGRKTIGQKRRNSPKELPWGEQSVHPSRKRDGNMSLRLVTRRDDMPLRPSINRPPVLTPKAFHKSRTTPIDTSWEGIRQRRPANYSINNNNCIDDTSPANHTITNTTGASLAKEVKILMDQRDARSPNNGGTMTPGRFRRVFATANLVFTPVKRRVRNSSQHAAKIVRSTRQRLRERKELRRQRRLARLKQPPRSWWIVIPADHPYKIAWDVMTMLWALLGAYRTHVRIREREFDQSPLIILTEIWFTLDILLNFVTEHKTRKGEVIRDGKSIWARYLTTWFVIDILSLIPWERIYVQPVVQRIKKRNIFQKTFFRSKAAIRVSRVLRGRHIKLFGQVSKQTGTPLRRMLAMIIKYVPKYLVFLRNMKGALVVRALRFVHWLHNMYKKIWVKAKTKARNTLRQKFRHPLFSPLRRPDEHDSDSDSDSDEDDLHSDDDDDDDDDNSLLDDDSSIDPSFHRVHSEGSPVVTMRRRCYSQNELRLQS